jgi:hypothetical protein
MKHRVGSHVPFSFVRLVRRLRFSPNNGQIRSLSIS